MKTKFDFEKHWTKEELNVFEYLNTPRQIQDFLDNTPYSCDPIYRSPRSVIRDKRAHCFDGALFAAAALRRIGFPPLIIDMLPYNDDDHLLAIFKVNNYYGSIAKSNFVGLRFREPVYKTLRELVMSYFESYYNLAYEKTLRGYTTTLNLSQFDSHNWMTNDEPLDLIADKLDKVKSFKILDDKQISIISKMDERTYQSGMLGVNPDGLFVPEN